MVKVDNEELLKHFITKYDMKNIFSRDMEEHMELYYYKKFEYLVKEEDTIQKLLFLVQGKAKVFTNLSNGKSLLLCFYQSFRVLGDIEVINAETTTYVNKTINANRADISLDKAFSSANKTVTNRDKINSDKAVTNVQAIEETYCIGISYENVRKYLMEDCKFLRYICSSLGVKLTRCSKNSSINLLFPLENRLASYIYTTGDRNGNSQKQKIYFSENLMEISELLGTSYRHLLRTLNNLCEKKVLRKTDEGYEVLDEEILVFLSADLYQ
jgi:CRP/FNR family transcriptional regulator, putaive post-exponential-phase nitrogen-starvation regulator